ncbi:MAG TPA: hypothetical protein VMT03_05790 [Polyangia bacterium]|nr:hypothetical protein [Polyangia bacterium]
MKFSDALIQAERWVNEISGVERVAEGIENGEPCITVFVSSKGATRQLPDRLGPWRIVIQGLHTDRDGAP